MWERKGYTVKMVDFDYDLKAFEIVEDNGRVQTIYPATIRDMNEIIIELNNGEEIDGWEDGNGNIITINRD